MALDFAAGCAGGAAGVLVGHPLDTVKVNIQTQDPTKGPAYKGTFDCLTKIAKADGVSGLYKGISSPLFAVAGINAITFGVYGNVIRRMENPESVTSVTLAGASAGLVQTVIVSPTELLKTQMQVGGQTSISSTIRNIWETAGLRGLTRGLGITFTREVPAFAVYFGSYEMLTRKLGDSTAAILTAGGLAGVFSWVATYPQDVIKSRLQADGYGAKQTYRGPMHCLQAGLKAEGGRFLTRGLASTMIRAFPMNAATFFVYKTITNYMGENTNVVEDVYDTLRSMKERQEPRVSTICTDMPNIILIQEQQNLSQTRFYPEQMLYACNPTPIRNSRVAQTVDESYYGYPLNMNQFNQIGTDVIPVIPTVIQSSSSILQRLQDISQEEEAVSECQRCKEGPHKPSLLATCKAVCNQWKTSVTMSDFLLPSLLKTNNRPDRIYGFYYLVA